MKILLTGTTGQLGQALNTFKPEGVELIATCRMGGDGLHTLDLSDGEACRAMVLKHQPDWVLNAGAYTAVDKAESEPELALAVNGNAPRAFAKALRETGGRLLQVSTDFVFNGRQGSPYLPEQARDPLGVYGSTKAAGEEAVEQVLGGSDRYVILRTSWVMGPVGANFARTMLRLHRERGAHGQSLGVVADQVGCPTSTQTLAAACWRIVETSASPRKESLPPVLHWSDAGAASWYDVAVAIGELAAELGLLVQPALVNPITTAEYPVPAKRPSYSLMNCTEARRILDLQPTHWRQALRQLMEAME
ncbi:dTDP-4-dehydrorhamnose reductase [Synechococcus sp. ATX 2A4]|uniref:dTDP-4-dehydrorhamnose reductase n=1 Tax=Synechococcus sp. ATX 2A4 TaxID=2823727 RepID=UPI0020CE3715|nr:dTDP-4-dehydrorhamnose reductase [Synechococcus sp. ATX 2A4]MCP9884385.1 dTDP-4-dehydrorhamnose reductase [Synechococcus sp. ATX 2A4]